MEVCPAFVDETGVLTAMLKEQPLYGVGLLVVPDPRLVTDSFYRAHFNFVADRTTRRNAIRQAILAEDRKLTIPELDRLMWATRHHEYKFSEVTQSNLQQYIDLMNIYFSFPQMEFHGLLVDRLDPEFSLDYWRREPWSAYLWLGQQLLKRRLSRKVFAVVDLQGKPKSADQYVEDALCALPNVVGCLRATSDMSIYLQIVDILLGCIQFDWKDHHKYYGATSRRADAKRELTAFIKAKMNMKRHEPILTDTVNFRKRTNPSTFTAWRWRAYRSKRRKSTAMSGAHPAGGTASSDHSVLSV